MFTCMYKYRDCSAELFPSCPKHCFAGLQELPATAGWEQQEALLVEESPVQTPHFSETARRLAPNNTSVITAIATLNPKTWQYQLFL